MARIRCQRLCKSDTPPEVWLAHRKERKKIASARWYAKKKRREIREENALRQTLEMQYQAQRASQPPYVFWRTPEDRWYWQSLLDHAVRGYPVRPDSVPAEQWCTWTSTVESQLQSTRQRLRGAVWQGVPWDDRFFTKILRQLGIRELRSAPQQPSRPSTNRTTSNTSQQPASVPGSVSSSSAPRALWTCGPWGVLFAGLVRRGLPLGWWPQIIRVTYQLPIHTDPANQTNPMLRHVHHSAAWTSPTASPSPHHTPHPNAHTEDHSDRIVTGSEAFRDPVSIATWDHWTRWMQQHLFPVVETETATVSSDGGRGGNGDQRPVSQIPVSWYDSEDERDWYEQWKTQPPSPEDTQEEEEEDDDDDTRTTDPNAEHLSDWWPDSLDSSEDSSPSE